MTDLGIVTKVPDTSTQKPWQSRTLWTALFSAVLPFIPGWTDIIKTHPEAYALAMTGIFAILRVISKDKIVIK